MRSKLQVVEVSPSERFNLANDPALDQKQLAQGRRKSERAAGTALTEHRDNAAHA